MQKQTKTDLTHHFLFEYVFMLLTNFGCVIEQDEILKNSLQCALNHLAEIISKEAMGNIVEQYVVTLYEN